ncbi:hypothetical protein C8J57DRAFT_1421242 [Mycena rebaudengoi]|nr:hypothetical protein C8J57DRAFT_1421242 [Mycena rebaudengoi]
MSYTYSYLPPELERKIFEIAATDHPKTIPTLLLVAQRVLQWIEPLLYRTPVMGPVRGQNNSRLNPAALLRARLKHIRHLLLYAGDDLTFRDLLRAIPLCEGLQTLQLFNVGILGALQKMQLRVQRVSIIKREDLQSIDPSLPLFRTLTHLEMRSRNDYADLNFAQLPALTHLSFYCGRFSPSCFGRIANWTTLHVLVNKIWYTPSWDRRRDSEHQSTYVDPRCVLMFYPTEPGPWVDDWEVGAAGGNDFWARAEVLINKRRRGEIEPASRFWIEESDQIE